MNFTSHVRAAKTSVKVARALVRIILRDGLQPGDRLPPERDMIGQFGVARGTLREALRLLEAQSLITLKAGPGGGPIVTRPSADSLAEYMSNVLAFYDATLDDFMVARMHLAPVVAFTAALRRTPEDVALLRHVLAAEEEARLEPALQPAAPDFYTAVALAAHNPVFLILTASLSGVNNASVAPLVRARLGEFIAMTDAPQAHEGVIEAIECGDAELARDRMYAHTTHICEFVRRSYPETPAVPLWRMIDAALGEPNPSLTAVGQPG